jgi:hypothetical protein
VRLIPVAEMMVIIAKMLSKSSIGSTAAWIQSKFWGGFVRSGSWFSFLQKVGMTLTGSWIQKVVASTGLAALWGSWWTD